MGIQAKYRACRYDSAVLSEWAADFNDLQRVSQLGSLAKELDMPLAQLALAWCLRQSNVTSVIIGATKPEQVTQNAGAAMRQLSTEVIERIEEILANKPGTQEY